MRKYFLTALRGSIALLIAFMLLLPETGKAQTTVVINTGTAGTPDYYPGPVYRSSGASTNDVSRYAYLYTEAELQAAGITPGSLISQVGWTKNNSATTNGAAKFRIYMKTSAATAYSSSTATWASLTGAATLVYENLSQDIPATAAPDYIPFLLTTPYLYTGGSLEVMTEWDISSVSGNPTTGAFNWLWSTVTDRNYGASGSSMSGISSLSSTGSYDNKRPFIQFTYSMAPACSGTPAGGTTTAPSTSLCNSTTPFSVSVTGTPVASGLNFQWQSSSDNTTYTDITGADDFNYNANSLAGNTWFRRKTSCGALFSYSAPIQIVVNAPAYAALPFTETFEADWTDACNIKDIPNNFWRNAPAFGNDSWRRNDNGSTAGWSSTFGSYSPASSEGSYSARFHSYDATSGFKGTFDLYLNCNTASTTKQLTFDFINDDGNDSLVIYVSTNGGTSFTRLDSIETSETWRTETIYFNSSAANTILRFVGVSDYGGSDIGIDNLLVKDFPMCSGTPVPGTATSTVASLCNPATPFTLRVDGATIAGGLTWQWQSSSNNTTYTNITGATDSVLNMPGLTTTTWFRRVTICSANSSNSTPIQVTVTPVTFATLPFTESFENTWISVCNTNDAPTNSWRNDPATGNRSWRRNDDGASANWTSPAFGDYLPEASTGTYSARFHASYASDNTMGNLDLYLNCNTGNLDKELSFDYINESGSDSLGIWISTDSGTNWTYLGSMYDDIDVWTKKTVYFKSNAAKVIIRFQATADYGSTDIGIDNIKIANFVPCTGTPVGGTTISSLTSVCSVTTPFRVGVSGATLAGGLLYQWEQSTNGTNFTAITGASDSVYNVAGITDTMWYRRKTTCGPTGNSTYSAPVRVVIIFPSYATLPYSESFEADWIDACDTRNAPNIYWRGHPTTGDASWRRYDDGASANWRSPDNGDYSPIASHGNWSARFHTYYAPDDSTGVLDLHLKCNTAAPNKRLQFDYINTTGNDTLGIWVSTNNGVSFTYIGTLELASDWTTHTFYFNSTSATTIVRFLATSDYGVTDIGIDNLIVADFPNCSGTPIGGKVNSTLTTVCDDNTGFTLTVTGSTIAAGLTYQWQTSSDGITWTNLTGGTEEKYTHDGISDSTYFRRKISCGTNSAYSDTLLVAPAAIKYVALPYSESFENNWINVCNTRDVPNEYWRNNPYSGNNSWRRHDDGAAGAWGNPPAGLYGPVAAVGNYSARFHSYNTSAVGNFDLYLNANTGIVAKRLTFSYINTSGSDSLIVLLSTDGGATFTRLDSVKTRAAWSTKTVYFNTNSATAVLRFTADGDFGSTDIGIDDIFIIDWVDCAGKPNKGVAQSSATTVCTEPFTLSATGITAGNGVEYQWQSSTNQTTWNDIPGAKNITLTHSQVGTTWYRLVTKCTLSGQSANSDSVKVISPPLAAGNFTINSGAPASATNFVSFNDAYNFIKCGISASVIFDVKTGTGPYNEQLIMSNVPGTSPTKTVTFKGNGVAKIAFGSTNTNERAVIKLKGARFIIFDSLVIDARGEDYGYGIQLMNNADSNTIKGCTIYADTTASSTGAAGVVISGSNTDAVATGTVLCDGNIISGNTIISGYYGITLTGTFNGGANGNNQIVKNNITDVYQYGIYVAGSYGTIIDGNRISRPTRSTVGDFHGIYFTTEKNTNCIVNGNRIYNPFGGATASAAAFYGINFNNTDGTQGGGENYVTNNAVYHVNGQGLAYGIANTSSDYVLYFHNTVSLDDATSTATAATRGFHQATTAGGLVFINNLISITRGGTGTKHAIYLGASLVAADYNDYYVSAAGGTNSIGYYQSDRTLLTDWRTATGIDQHSLSVIPAFVDPSNGNFTPGNAGIDNRGVGTGIVDKDINANARNASTPDIGAFEFTPPPCSVPPVTGTVRIVPNDICQNRPVVLSMNIGPYGSAQMFQWQIAANQNGPFTNFGDPMLTPDTTINATITRYYRVAITCGTSTVYSDTVKHTVIPALPAGTYTINKGNPTNYVPGTPGGNFESFAHAKAAMSCGITGGPVVFNVQTGSGPYIEKLKLDSIPGTSSVNTITFNGNGNTITDTSSDAGDRAVIKLTGTDHIIFDSLIIDASGDTHHTGIELISDADSNVFRKCTILSSLTATTTDYNGIVINFSSPGPISGGNTRCDGNTFDRNTIKGGYYGITLVGAASPNFVHNNRFTNNNISEFYFAGIYLAGTSNTLIADNKFSRPTRTNTNTNLYGIYLTSQPSLKLHITRNRFHNMFGGQAASTSAFYGIYHNGVDAATGAEDTVSNNLFYNIGGTGAQYALYNTGSNNVLYLHNTIALDDATPSTAATVGFYHTTSANNLHFRNNMVTVTREGTGNKHAIYLGSTSSEVFSNTNNLYVKGQNAWVGYYNANRATLADWSGVSNLDTNSVSENPLYTDVANGDLTPQLASIDNKAKPLGIPIDITGAARHATTPDIGAYEFSPRPCQTPPVAGTASVTPSSGVCLEAPLTLNITGHSPLGNITFQWQTSSNGTDWTDLSPVQYFPEFKTVSTISTWYRAAVTCTGNTVYTQPVQLTLNNILLAGTYTIDGANATGGTNFKTFGDAVNAMLCGISGKVVFNIKPGTYNEQVTIPYIPGTSATATVTFQSENGNASSATLSHNASTSSNFTLKLDSTKNFIFKNFTIVAANAVSGRAIELTNYASYDSIVNCVITSPITSVNNTDAVGIYANTFKGKNIVIKGNNIYTGTHGIYFTGTSNSVLGLAGHIIESNTVNTPNGHGIMVQNMDSIQILKNTVNLKNNPAANAAGIFTNYVDSASRIIGNTVNIENVTSPAVYGIQIQNTRAVYDDSAVVAANKVIAGAGNTGSIYGLTLAGSKNVSVVNNVIAINSAGATAYGLHNQNNVENINYYNNTSNMEATAASGYPGYFTQNAAGNINVRNNIFSNSGGGKALFVNNPARFTSDYNMIYSSGAKLVQTATGSPTEFDNIYEWKKIWNWDRFSISHAPAFANNTDLRPALNNPDVWAMHGRGVQITGNTYDFDNKNRPDVLTAGVPDLGAYEFYPTAQPTVLAAIPATPAPNTTQTFYYGSDTVMRISWAATAPASVSVRRFSGEVPDGLVAGTDSMFFYTKVEIPGGANYNYAAKLYYIDPWQGSIPKQTQIGLGRTTPSNAWVVGQNSKVDVGKKEITQEAIVYLDRFTGLVNPFAQEENEDSSSNRGKDFWVGYQRTNGFSGGGGGAQEMKLYLGAGDIPANVTVTIEGTSGTPWVRTYAVPANSAMISDEIPKTGTDDARLVQEGIWPKKGIHITSDVPVVAYAHIYELANSGATMLMPTAVWGYEYYTLTSSQEYSSESSSAFHIVAQHDSTWVEINPSNPTRGGWVKNGGTRPNGSYLVKLNKGDAYQVLGQIESGSVGYDLTGSYVKSVGNAQGDCFPIAVFSGSTRTSIQCAGEFGSSGDLILQQVFPYQAWGNKYATAPASTIDGPNPSSNQESIYRIMVKDPTAVVKVNGKTLSGIINNRYYQYQSDSADYIESNRPILVAQYLASEDGCINTGDSSDPEMFYLSPLQQAVKKTQFYRNDKDEIGKNFITLVIPTEGLPTLKIDGVNYQAYPATERYVYDHPHLQGYSVVTKRWEEGSGSSTVESEMPFTGIVYGLGSVESYGYNLGTLVKNLNNLSGVNTQFNTSANPTGYTCKNAPFTMTVLLPIVPETLTWQFSKVKKLQPNVDSVQQSPKPIDTVVINGIEYYVFTVAASFTFDTAGNINIPIKYSSPTIERCDQTETGAVVVQILPSPITDFEIKFPGGGTKGCEGTTVDFKGDLITQNGIAINKWNWTFHDNSKPTGQDQTFQYPAAGTYPVKLSGITADGCVSDTIKNVVIEAKPVVDVVAENLPGCPNLPVTFTVSNPVTGVTYNWYDATTGGTQVGTGVTFSPTNPTPPVNFYVEGVSEAGCISTSRVKVTVTVPDQVKPVVRVDSTGVREIKFAWDAVPGATAYEVSTNGGATWVTPSSGPTGLTHLVTGLTPLQEVGLIVKAKAVCGEIESDELKARTKGDQIFIPNAFTPNGDGRNDMLLVYGWTIKEMKFMVFNQWGQKIFESSSQTVGWDGKWKGKAQPSGVYMYVCRIIQHDGSEVIRKGSINLIR